MPATATFPDGADLASDRADSLPAIVPVAAMGRSYARIAWPGAAMAPQLPRSASLLILPVRERGRGSARMSTWRGTL